MSTQPNLATSIPGRGIHPGFLPHAFDSVREANNTLSANGWTGAAAAIATIEPTRRVILLQVESSSDG